MKSHLVNKLERLYNIYIITDRDKWLIDRLLVV